jgi:hypothetical protein
MLAFIKDLVVLISTQTDISIVLLDEPVSIAHFCVNTQCTFL